MEVELAIMERRSVREYTDQAVEEEYLTKILESGLWAPSGANNQPWVFVCITDPTTIKDIHAVSPGMFSAPPALICICSDQNKTRKFKLGPTLAQFDCAMAAQNIILRAFSLGLGSCVIRSTNLSAIKEILEAPEHISPELIITLGYPALIPQPPPRMRDAIFWQKFGHAGEFV